MRASTVFKLLGFLLMMLLAAYILRNFSLEKLFSDFQAEKILQEYLQVKMNPLEVLKKFFDRIIEFLTGGEA